MKLLIAIVLAAVMMGATTRPATAPAALAAVLKVGMTVEQFDEIIGVKGSGKTISGVDYFQWRAASQWRPVAIVNANAKDGVVKSFNIVNYSQKSNPARRPGDPATQPK